MKRIPGACSLGRAFPLALLLAGCAASGGSAVRDAGDEGQDTTVEAAPARAALEGPSDDELAKALDLRSAERALLARHPSLAEARARARALRAQARAEGSLPPPELMTELEQRTLAQTPMWMLSVWQTIPPLAALDAMERAMEREAAAADAMVRAEGRMLLRELDQAFAMYAEGTHRRSALDKHLRLVGRMAAAARARYAATAPLADIVQADLERTRVEADLAQVLGDIDVARAMINGLLVRKVDAPLGAPRDTHPETAAADTGTLVARAEAHPEIMAARGMRDAAASAAAAAESEANVPMFRVGGTYYQPIDGMEPPGWGVALSMELPWIWGGAGAKAEAALERKRAATAGIAVARVRVRTAVAQALAGVRAAEKRLIVLARRARPAARRSLQATAAGYASGGTDILSWLDAARGALDVEIDFAMARGDLDRALADLDWAVGEHVKRAPLDLEGDQVSSPEPTAGKDSGG